MTSRPSLPTKADPGRFWESFRLDPELVRTNSCANSQYSSTITVLEALHK